MALRPRIQADPGTGSGRDEQASRFMDWIGAGEGIRDTGIHLDGSPESDMNRLNMAGSSQVFK